MSQWLRFFLIGVKETAMQGVAVFDAIIQLQQDLLERLKHLGARTSNGIKVMEYLYTQPVIDVSQVEKIIQKSNVTAYKLIDALEKLGVLHEISGMQRNRLYLFKEYFDLFKSE